MDLAALAARCRARLAELELPRPFDIRALCRGVERRRGRPLVLLGLALPADGPRGLWISAAERDYLIYERNTSPLHQEHIILHELSHLLCGHTGTATLTEEHARLLFPALDPGMVGRVLGRTGYSTEEEQEAELLASMILRTVQRNRTVPAIPDEATAENLRRLEAGL